MSEELNRYIASVFTMEDTSSIPELQESQVSEVIAMAFTKEMVLEKLKGLKVDKSPRPDGLHCRVLKEIAEENVLVLVIPDKLLEFFGEVMSKFDKEKPVDMIYLDFQKACDKVLQTKLLNKTRAH
eukprot:g24239.t1